MLKLRDEKLDIESKLEERDGKDHYLKEEIVQLQDKVNGKDQAIKQLGKTIIERGQENEKLAEMVCFFKNRLITENCFHTTFSAQKL